MSAVTLSLVAGSHLQVAGRRACEPAIARYAVLGLGESERQMDLVYRWEKKKSGT